MNISEDAQWGDPANGTGGIVELTETAKIATSVVYGIIFICGAAGNVLVILVIWMLRSKTLVQRSLSWHMMSMACSDLLILTVGLPIELYGIIWNPHPWPIGNAGCKGFYLLWEVCSYASIFNVLTLSLERYIAICHPLQIKLMATSRTSSLIGLVWALASITGLPAAFAIGVEDAWKPFRPRGDGRPPLNICTNISGRMSLFRLVIYLSFSLYVLVLLLVGFTCREMMKTLLRSRQASSTLQKSNPTGKVTPRFKEIRRQNIVMLGCIVATLAVCWFPFQARRLMAAIQSKSQWTEHYYSSYLAMQPITNSLYYICSAINPFLYNVTSKQFRKMFRQVLRGCCWSGPIPSVYERNAHSDVKQEPN
ncbi:G-protein coupled receptor 39-like [Hypanus sabinus]|uniref:G-protein coupled receptor 39-like n=1 Tax=Hypanus sabinus TaxID=79690 RepID=UPI0028C39958|nr:G-protein coupled receptor 39-like [Hypanus sabinus]